MGFSMFTGTYVAACLQGVDTTRDGLADLRAGPTSHFAESEPKQKVNATETGRAEDILSWPYSPAPRLPTSAAYNSRGTPRCYNRTQRRIEFRGDT